jgi:hypothetical protein
MKALSVCQPWAWALIYGPKRIENRSRETRYRGLLVIHAGLSRKRLGDAGDLLPGAPADEDLVYGAMLGTVQLVDCVPLADVATCRHNVGDIRFAAGAWCLITADPRPFRSPIPWRGRLGLFNVPDGIISREIARV